MAAVCTSHVCASWILSAGESIAGREYFLCRITAPCSFVCSNVAACQMARLWGAFFRPYFVRPYDLTSGMYCTYDIFVATVLNCGDSEEKDDVPAHTNLMSKVFSLLLLLRLLMLEQLVVVAVAAVVVLVLLFVPGRLVVVVMVVPVVVATAAVAATMMAVAVVSVAVLLLLVPPKPLLELLLPLRLLLLVLLVLVVVAAAAAAASAATPAAACCVGSSCFDGSGGGGGIFNACCVCYCRGTAVVSVYDMSTVHWFGYFSCV